MQGAVFLQQFKATAYVRRFKLLCHRLRLMNGGVVQHHYPAITDINHLASDIFLTPVNSTVIVVKFFYALDRLWPCKQNDNRQGNSHKHGTAAPSAGLNYLNRRDHY